MAKRFAFVTRVELNLLVDPENTKKKSLYTLLANIFRKTHGLSCSLSYANHVKGCQLVSKIFISRVRNILSPLYYHFV